MTGAAVLAAAGLLGLGTVASAFASLRRALLVQAAGAAALGVAGFAALGAGSTAGPGFTSAFAPRFGVDGLTAFFLATLEIA